MEEAAGRDPSPPRALRPAQLGIILLGRVTLGHIGATVMDLAERGYLRLEHADDDWQITILEAEPDGLLDYERTLVRGLPGGPRAFRLGLVTAEMIPLLDRVRSRIVRDAARAGRVGSCGVLRTVRNSCGKSRSSGRSFVSWPWTAMPGHWRGTLRTRWSSG